MEAFELRLKSLHLKLTFKVFNALVTVGLLLLWLGGVAGHFQVCASCLLILQITEGYIFSLITTTALDVVGVVIRL